MMIGQRLNMCDIISKNIELNFTQNMDDSLLGDIQN